MNCTKCKKPVTGKPNYFDFYHDKKLWRWPFCNWECQLEWYTVAQVNGPTEEARVLHFGPESQK